MLDFTQTNLHKAAQATTLAGQSMAGKNSFIKLYTEPHTVCNKLVGFPRGTSSIYSKSIEPHRPGPRACIISSGDIQINALKQWCHRDCAVAITKINGSQVIIASVYLDIKAAARPPWLDNLLDMASQKRYPIILGIDTNAHSTLYGPDSNSRGDEIEDFILHHGLTVENQGNDPTFETRRGNNWIKTHIDVTLTRDLPCQLVGWRVDRSYNASDHNDIRFQVNQAAPQPQKIRPWSKADWVTFRSLLSTADYMIPSRMTMKKLDRTLHRLYRILNHAIDTACPKITITPTVKKDHWSTEEHKVSKARVSGLYKQAKTSGNDVDWKIYRDADRAFKKKCKRDKNAAWRQYKENLQTTKDTAALVKLAQRTERNQVSVLERSDGTNTEPGKETVDLLARTHFPASTDTRRIIYNNRRALDTAAIKHKYDDWINVRLITEALGGFEKKKSPGPDEIKPLLFEHLPPEFIETLMIIYKSTIHLGYTPKLWRQTKVIFISKPGKDSYQKPKSFRPISLSNYLLKGLERLVCWRMDKALLSNPLHHKQHGFLAGKSTESAISNTVDYIEQHIMRRQHCVGVFLDISSAFDSIKPGHVRQALLKHGGDPELVQWYYDYITHRDIQISLHGHNFTFSTGIGFPQGGVCSAKFWLIAFDYAIQIINRYNIEGNGYADDCAALYGGPRLDHALKRLQKMLDDLTTWGRECGLHFNPEKSIAVVLSLIHI